MKLLKFKLHESVYTFLYSIFFVKLHILHLKTSMYFPKNNEILLLNHHTIIACNKISSNSLISSNIQCIFILYQLSPKCLFNCCFETKVYSRITNIWLLDFLKIFLFIVERWCERAFWWEGQKEREKLKKSPL